MFIIYLVNRIANDNVEKNIEGKGVSKMFFIITPVNFGRPYSITKSVSWDPFIKLD